MKALAYVITDSEGIHARPAGLLVKEAASCSCEVTITKNEKEVDAKRLLSVMALGVKCGEEIIVKTDGADEDVAIEKMRKFLEENL